VKGDWWEGAERKSEEKMTNDEWPAFAKGYGTAGE
jgi:hypothetical protein